MTETPSAPAHHRPRQADVVRVPRRRRGRRDPEHRAGGDGRQAGLLHGDGRRPPDHAGRARRADRDERAVRPRVAEQPGRRWRTSTTTRRPGVTRCPPSTPSRSRTRRARPTWRVSSSSRSAPSGTLPTSSPPLVTATGSAGTSTTATSTTGASGSSGPCTTATCSTEWIPALEGVAAKLEAGGRVADVGCGHGASTILLAQAFPNATFVGSDYHAESIAVARERAAAAGVDDRVTFEVAAGDRLQRHGVRPDRDVRLAARHGRPGRRGPARARRDRRRRHVDGRRADGGRPRRGQPQHRSAAPTTASRRCCARPRP